MKVVAESYYVLGAVNGIRFCSGNSDKNLCHCDTEDAHKEKDKSSRRHWYIGLVMFVINILYQLWAQSLKNDLLSINVLFV